MKNLYGTGLATTAISFGLSLAVNGAVLYGIGHAVRPQMAAEKSDLLAKLAAKQKDDSIDFQYVETSAGSALDKPRETGRISDKDSAARDLAPKTSFSGDEPQLAPGVSDQLAQQRAMPAPSPASAPSPPRPAQAPQPQTVEEEKPRPEQEEKQPATTTPNEKEAADEEVVAAPVRENLPPKEETPKSSIEDLLKPKQAVPPRPPTVAARPIPALPSGRDNITTPPSSRKLSAGARMEGQVSFEATGSGMGAYMKNLKEKIWMEWFPYLALQYPLDFKTADAVIAFTIDPEGNLKSVKVLENDGSPVFAQYCAGAVRNIKNFGKIPPEIMALLDKEELEIKFAFHYR